ncbi:copper chaperone PCu(A)C [Comamonas testosteroni]|uniref:copper chaperone PCu(A)C n=1 Tax=Comamonas testosteroni TaxID=285 RepID=UPI00265E48BB|nr:copper chaperone PCu(A)C [Comamonas testosteroni]WKL16355.1 copper chaperone PCu(A)C [Comamonas testosteroni]WQD45195.1 copper chaperone PCu(A)C [Comamonas testosteroni]
MKLAIRSLVAAATLIAAAAAQAQVTVKDAWVRATVPQQKATGAFMQLQSTKDTKLVSASSPLTPNVEVHEMAMQDNVMKMRQVPAIELPAGKVVELKPGSYHVMLMNLQKPVSVGDTVSLTLSFESKDGKRETVEVQAPVRPLNSNAAPAGHGGHTH